MKELFEKYGIPLSSLQESQFEHFLDIFLETNAQINLSAIRDRDGVILKHFVDSLMLSPYLPDMINTFDLHKKNLQFLDLGTGWWFPGIPLAIYYPNDHFTLLDTRRKKCECVGTFCKQIGLTNVTVVWWRAENPSEWKVVFGDMTPGNFDIVVSLATAHLRELQEWSTPLLKKSGLLISYKTPSQDELDSSQKIDITKSYELEWQERFLLIWKKQEKARK